MNADGRFLFCCAGAEMGGPCTIQCPRYICDRRMPRHLHKEVRRDTYNTQGALIGEHLRCQTCRAWWYLGAAFDAIPEKNVYASTA